MTSKDKTKANKILNTAAPIYGALLASTDLINFDPAKESDKQKAAAVLTNMADLSIVAAQTLIKGVGINVRKQAEAAETEEE